MYVCPGQPIKSIAKIPRHRGHTLMNQRIASAATIHANRLRNCIMPSDKDMEKEGKATIVIKTFKSVDVTLCNIKGFDN